MTEKKSLINTMEDLSQDLAATHRSVNHDSMDTSALATHIASVKENGYVIIENLLTSEQLHAIRSGVTPCLTRFGRNNFEGERTQRVYGLLGKTVCCDGLVEHPIILGLLQALLLPNYLLSQAQVINIHPGEAAQPLHFDDAFYMIPRPRPHFGVAVIWAIDDFTHDNGATVLIPRSHTWDVRQPGPADLLLPAIMPAGSALVFLGTLWHGGGANRASRPRLAMTAQYCQPWARTQENMFLSVPKEMVRNRSAVMKSMLGYSIHPPFMGMVNGTSPLRSLD